MPLQMVVAVSIKIDTRGPVLFRQTRISAGGRPFEMLKFRTLTVETYPWPSGAGPLLQLHRDRRLTRAGRFLRPSFLDELPQLVNVLRGDMSLVGPKALHVGAIDDGDQFLGWRLLVKPGMTSLAQASGRRNVSWDDEMSLAFYYAETASMRLDLSILVRSLARSMRAMMGRCGR